jgi:hypothetical protein
LAAPRALAGLLAMAEVEERSSIGSGWTLNYLF